MYYEIVPPNNAVNYCFTNLFLQFNSDCICFLDIDRIRPQLVL